jgi:hypothetical protein
MLDQLVDNEKIMKTNLTIIPRFLKGAAEAIEQDKLQSV